MRVALVHPHAALTGGVERQIHDLALHLLGDGHEVHYFCRSVDARVDPRIRIHRVPDPARPLPSARIWLFDRLSRRAVERAGPFDLVHGFGRTSEQDVYREGGGCLADYQVYSIDGMASPWRRAWRRASPKQWVMSRIERGRYGGCRLRRVLAISGMLRDQILHRYDVPPERIEVIYPGVDLERFRLDPAARGVVGAELALPDGAPLLIFVGSDFRRKGLSTLLTALVRLPGVHALVLGRDRPKRVANLRVRAERLGLGRRTHFLGFREQPERYLAAADCLVYPTLYDAFGNTVLEAMASGTPAVVSRRAGSAEIVVDGKTGAVVDLPDDVLGLADAIRPFLEPAVGAEAGRLARREAEQFSWQTHYARVMEVYRELLPDAAAGSIRTRRYAVKI